MSGRAKLVEWMRMRGQTQRSFARELGVTQSGLSRWVSGPNVPSWTHIRTIERVTNGFIRLSDWADAAAERETVEP